MKIRTILFPTDFSAVAANALDFAAGWARQLDANLVMVHANTEPYGEPAQESGSIPLDSVNNRLINEKLGSLVEDVQVKYGINCHTYIAEGDAEEVIESTVANLRADMVVMGMVGSEGSFADSLTARVMQRVTCPLLIVPQEARYEPASYWMYASSLGKNENVLLRQIMNLAAGFNAKVEMLHVLEGAEREAEGRNWLDELREVMPSLNFSYTALAGENVLESLSAHIERRQPNLLVMARHRQSWWERTFTQDKVRATADRINFPLLVVYDPMA